MARLRVSLGGKKKFNRIILNLPGVQKRLDQITREEEGKARARLARHRKTGDHGIRVYRERHTRVIEFFSKTLEGSPMSVQFGHFRYGKWVPGLNILPATPSTRGPDGA